MVLTTNFEMTDRRRRRPKVVPRAAADFVRQLKMSKKLSVYVIYEYAYLSIRMTHGWII